MDRANVVIIGGGVIGCAIAMEVAARWGDVFVLEQMPRLGMLASTRNSGVIHSGIYYEPGSWKARLCVEGNRLLYAFCAAHGVPHRRTGKLIVASSAAEAEELPALVELGCRNGVQGPRILDAAGIRAREPHIVGVAAIEVPSTGILISEDLVKAFARIAVDRGAAILTHAKVERLEPQGDSIRVFAGEAGEIEARCVVNAAGLFADEVAALLSGAAGRSLRQPYKIYPVRGDYAEVVKHKSHLVNGLVYPLPHSGGLSLGVHFTKTMWETFLVGPTARYVADKNDYESSPEPLEEFARRAQAMLPELTAADLTPAYSGIRAKLTPPDQKGRGDFIIEHDAEFPRVIQLVGMESPGLTSSLAIARHVQAMIAETLR
jgi:glycerol-3-phosphate dehydrogenase